MSAPAERFPTEPFAHPALYYRGDAEFLAGTIPFIVAGLHAGDPVAVAVPEPHLNLLCAELGADADLVHLVDLTVTGRNPGRIIPGVLHAFADRFSERHVRIVGEPLWPGRSPAEYAACVQHEALINSAFAGRLMTILCPYDALNLPQTALADAARTHPVVMHARHSSGERGPGPGTGRNWGFAPEHMLARYGLPMVDPPADAEVLRVRSSRDLAGMRRGVEEHAIRFGFPEHRRYDIALAVTELATNSLEHGGGSAVISLFVEGDHLVCQVADRGQLLDPLAGRRVPEPGQTRGRGLLMVNQLADLVRVHTSVDGTVIAASFLRP